MVNIKGGSCRLDKNHKVLTTMMIAASLMLVGAAEKQLKSLSSPE